MFYMLQEFLSCRNRPLFYYVPLFLFDLTRSYFLLSLFLFIFYPYSTIRCKYLPFSFLAIILGNNFSEYFAYTTPNIFISDQSSY